MKGGFPIVLYYITRTFPGGRFPHREKGGSTTFFTGFSLRLPARRPWSLHSCPLFDASNSMEFGGSKDTYWRFTLPETNIAHKNPPFWWYLPGKMGILMGYVSFREGRCIRPVIKSGINMHQVININYTYRLLVGFFGSKQKCQLRVLQDLWKFFFGCCEGGLEIGNLTMKSRVNSVDDPFRPLDVRIVTV